METPWTSELAYSIGIIVADGALSPDGRHIELISKERAHVEYVKKVLEVRAAIIPRETGKLGKGKAHFKIRWRDAKTYSFLSDIGFRPYKNFTLGTLKIPDKYFFDFLRGYQESDTHFSSYFDPYWRENKLFHVLFSMPSFEYAIWIQETIERLIGLKGNMGRMENATRITTLKYAKQEAMSLISHMSLSSGVLPESRKRLKITRALAIVGISLQTS